MTLPALTFGAFADDRLLGLELERLIGKYGIRSAVETGTHQGETTRALAAMVPVVHTIEISPASFAESQERLAGIPNIRQHYGASQEILPDLLPQLTRPTLYYLDAHWNGHFPLPEEVEIIVAHDPSPVIMIHDMQVPGHPEFHADTQPNGVPYNFEWVQPSLMKIREPWHYYYNKKAEGLKIGILFVVPDEVPGG